MKSPAWAVAGLCLLWTGLAWCTEGVRDARERADLQPGLVGADSIDPQYLVYEVHELEVVLAASDPPSKKPDSVRHAKEKESLLQRLDKKHESWNEHHARHRLLEALRGFSGYAETQQAELNRLKGLYSHTPKKQKKLLERQVNYSKKFTDIAGLLTKNQQLCDDLVRNAMDFYGIDQYELDQHTQSMKAAGRGPDRVSVSQALKHFVRDWSASGARERDAAFPCILKTLKDLFPNPKEDEVKVLLPGAGLGRLGHEVAQLPRFLVTNNEWSAYQNVAYRFLDHQPHANRPDSSTFYPFVDSWSHHHSTSNMLRPVAFPDIPFDPAAVLLVEGDFTTAFGNKTATYDAVVTHFFIDTARNLMSYFDTIARLLKPGGYWINFGPLLYGSAPFVQLSLEEIVKVAQGMGFEFLEAASQGFSESAECGVRDEVLPVYGVEAVYGFDERALTRNAYEAMFWVARRG